VELRQTLIKKLLISNRGEIAVRIIRARAELGITSVAIYTDVDRHALHVKKADEAYNIGADPLASYLNVRRIVALARATGCDALHPGYGFLSENPRLAEYCQRHRICFVGPPAHVIRRLGDKIEARQAMQAAGIPIISGSNTNLEGLDNALILAEQIGYPVMLKATAGGGGRGIRRCNSPLELRRSYERVISEAQKAFGSTEIFLEKCVVNPRHIEVQVLADHQGNIIHLFERDCSIQRRHQKLIGIGPSPQLNEKQQIRVGKLAVKACQAVGYRNAGTVESLLDAEGNFYFMEMNTRLQVEHPVTGVDIVQEQLLIAAGESLSYRQEDIQHRGYVMEFRINANDFLPSFGRITRYYAPGGPGVRTNRAILPPYFDSLCVKLTVWAMTCEKLLNRAHQALQDMGIYGIKTTLPYYRKILLSLDFRREALILPSWTTIRSC
jgi:pyruvate carboxylase subunit A